jgi:hypothetical protein
MTFTIPDLPFVPAILLGSVLMISVAVVIEELMPLFDPPRTEEVEVHHPYGAGGSVIVRRYLPPGPS